MSEPFNELTGELEIAQPSIDDKLNHVMADLAVLNSKIDNLGQGTAAIYAGLSNLITMLQAVQQAASMMPGAGKFMKKFMAENGGANNVG